MGACIWLGIDLHQFAHQPSGHSDAPIHFAISPGEKFDSLAARLKSKGLISSKRRFKVLARFKGADKRLKAGEYHLATMMSPVQVLDVLVDGEVLLHRLTIPEGYNLMQIAAEIDRSAIADAEQFITLATDEKLVRRLGFDGPTLEGYLFPDTYYFPNDVSAETIISKMVQQFEEQFSVQWRRRAEEIKLSIHQVVTLASIIEKETGDPQERPIIASVFHNRLKKKMRLESDPTVIYGIENFDGNITRRHLTTRTPYNTYMIRGLPPGPIANPGRLALEAALYPVQTDYLFFVSKKDRTHYFSATIEEHNQAVRKYQLRRRRK